ncbi:hypothetical protein D0812_11660 [Vibrio owensii]|uniref:Nucleoid-associated protein n=1 Tax=Vibrio owensii TaxID=696485 RepID=A0AAP9KA90_9VIBR|nr:nucleoid-associated protein [Vibrio owensii]AYO15035.1 hypothetical protein D0812_11660 [Vibrio owensii]QGH47246.1 hypothetical protein APZ19_09185 [Vibrio owensii]
MHFINCSCYHLSIENGTYAKFVEKQNSRENFRDFAATALEKVVENGSTQQYVFQNDSDVKKEFLTYLSNADYWTVFCELMTGYLISSQQISQKSVERMGRKVTPGSLLLIHYKPTDNDVDVLVLIKMEQEEFASVEDFEHQFGLPAEKRALNTAVITFSENDKQELYVSRTLAFWVNFLGVTPLREDRLNTFNAFKAIDKTLTTKVKNKGYKADHLMLRNHLLTYLRNKSNDVVSYQELIEEIFAKHVPLNRDFDAKSLVSDLQKHPSKSKDGFDGQFRVNMEDINAKRRKLPIALSDGIELNLTDGVLGLEETIIPHEEDGRKGIIIFSEVGYDHFKKDSESN